MNKKSLLLFLIGAFSLTQVHMVGYIGVSELAMLITAPVVCLKNLKLLQRHGFGKVLILVLCWAASALVSDLVNHNIAANMLRGMASPLSVFASIVVLHHLLYDDILRVRWLLVGFTVTTILSMFVLQQGSARAIAEWTGVSSREVALGYKLSLLSVAAAVCSLPVQIAYLRIPNLSVLLAVALGFLALQQGGRSSFLAFLLSAGMMMIIAGKESRIARIRQLLPLLLVGIVLIFFAGKKVYGFAATRGYMGEMERVKYEQQSASRIGLMSGRMDFIGGVLAIRDAPLLGYGSWALDVGDYRVRAAEWIGGDEAVQEAASQRMHFMPGHSHLIGAWVWSGVMGGMFWIYVLVKLWRVIGGGLGAVPQLYGYFALALPSAFWDILFSPFGDRPFMAALITLSLMVGRSWERRQQALRQNLPPPPPWRLDYVRT